MPLRFEGKGRYRTVVKNGFGRIRQQVLRTSHYIRFPLNFRGNLHFEGDIMAAKISDGELLKVIDRFMDADKICRATDLKLKTLQARIGKLTYKNLLESPSQIKGLYKPKPKIVKLSQNAIIIPKARIEDADFKIGDMFKVTCEEDRIILSRL